jgi:hypothetical protein
MAVSRLLEGRGGKWRRRVLADFFLFYFFNAVLSLRQDFFQFSGLGFFYFQLIENFITDLI